MDDASDFHRASQQIWDSMAAGWESRHAYFEQAARPVTEAMIARLDPQAGQVVLDLAAGTGMVGFAAAPAVGADGRIIVSDFAEQMVLAARRRAEALGLHNVECRQLDAERLDLPDGAVDGVLCRWGYMLMAHPLQALRETRRALRDGGTLSLSVFGSGAENPWAALPMQALVEGGWAAQPAPGTPGILALGDRGRLRQLITEAGFADPDVADVPFDWTFPDDDSYWEYLVDAAGAIAMVIAGLDDDQRREARRRIEEIIEPHRTADGIRLPAVAVVASTTAAR